MTQNTWQWFFNFVMTLDIIQVILDTTKLWIFFPNIYNGSKYGEIETNLITSCDICSISKNPPYCPYGFLQPLFISVYTMFFGFYELHYIFINNNFIMVDRFTKMVHFVRCKKPSSSENKPILLLEKIYHSLPNNIVSN